MYKLSVIKNPVGTYHFVGSVPSNLAFVSSSPKYIELALQCGPGLARKVAEKEGGTFKTRTFQTEAEAWEAASGSGT